MSISRRIIVRCLLASLFAATAQRVFGEHTPHVSPSDTARSLPAAVVTAARSTPRTASGAPIYELSPQTLRLIPSSEVSAALRLIPGLLVRDLGARGAEITVGTRGLSAAHTVVADDGFPISDAESGVVDVSRFDPSRTAALTLSLLDADALLMPARLLAGALLEVRSAAPPTRFRIETGAFGHFAASAEGALRLGRHRLSASADFARADNDFPYRYVNGHTTVTARRSHARFYKFAPRLNWTFRATAGDEWELSYVGHYTDRQLPGATRLYAVADGENLSDDDTAVRAFWKRSRGAWQTEVRALQNFHVKDYEDRDAQYPGGVRREIYRQRETWFSVGTAFAFSRCWKIAYVSDFTHTALTTSGQTDRTATRGVLRHALSLRFGTTRRILTLRLFRQDSDNDAQGEIMAHRAARDDHRFGYSFSATEKLSLAHHTKVALRAAAQSTSRLPAFAETYYFRYGNPKLRAERAFRLNVGMTCMLHADDRARWRIEASTDAFVDRIADGIVAVPITPAIWRTENLDRIHGAGIDAVLSATHTSGRHTVWTLRTNYSFHRVVDRSSPSSAAYDQTLPYHPTSQGQVLLGFRRKALQLSSSLSGVSQRWATPQHLAASRLSPHWEWDMAATHRWRIGKTCLTLRAAVTNLTDTRRESVRGYPLPGRAWTLGATFEL